MSTKVRKEGGNKVKRQKEGEGTSPEEQVNWATGHDSSFDQLWRAATDDYQLRPHQMRTYWKRSCYIRKGRQQLQKKKEKTGEGKDWTLSTDDDVSCPGSVLFFSMRRLMLSLLFRQPLRPLSPTATLN